MNILPALTFLVAVFFSLVQMKDLQIYEAYCQNKPRSESLWRQCSDCAFFQVSLIFTATNSNNVLRHKLSMIWFVNQECQKKLEHKLGLDSYLLKPVQRITKYQLLLKVSAVPFPSFKFYVYLTNIYPFWSGHKIPFMDMCLNKALSPILALSCCTLVHLQQQIKAATEALVGTCGGKYLRAELCPKVSCFCPNMLCNLCRSC